MAKDATIICPMMGGEPCVEDGAVRNGVLVKCRFWVNVLGTNPQTNETINGGDCAIAWMPMLLIENSKINRETGSAVESMRNTNVTASTQIAKAIMLASNNPVKEIAS